MKFKKSTAIIPMLLLTMTFSCNKDEPTVVAQDTPKPVVNLNPNSGNIATVDLGVSGEYVILSKTGVTNVFRSAITGNVGASPISGSAILLACDEVTGTINTVDAAGPACKITDATKLTTAVSNMQTAYTNLETRINPNYLNVGAGTIGGRTFPRGLYKWSSSVTVPTDITISGGPDDIWVFQVAGTLNVSSGVKVILSGGAQSKNIFWQVSDVVTLNTTSKFEGSILGKSGINLKTGASINGLLMAQTAVSLEMSTVKRPL